MEGRFSATGPRGTSQQFHFYSSVLLSSPRPICWSPLTPASPPPTQPRPLPEAAGNGPGRNFRFSGFFLLPLPFRTPYTPRSLLQPLSLELANHIPWVQPSSPGDLLKALFQRSGVLLLLGIPVNTVTPLPASFTDALSEKEGSGKLLCLGGEGRGGIQLPWPGLAFPPCPLCGKVTGFKGLGKAVLSARLSASGFLAHSNSERDLSPVKVGRNLSESNYLEEPSLENTFFCFQTGKRTCHSNESRGHLDLYQLKC